jgi:3'-phosphoadenosine 5'-phosphosulfate sulfotransferase (PAPS reductase)/FAD synthetase
MNHVVMYSSGIGSWAAAKRVVERYGTANVKLLFCDTKIEDEDNYRFLKDSSENIGAELVWLQDGRDVFDVFKDVKFMGNSRVDPCSRILKRELADKWIADNYSPETVQVYVGIDWTEEHRYKRMAPRKLPWRYYAPLTEHPLLTKAQLLEWARSESVEPPRMYRYGFQHANCGGFCIKSGQAQFKLLWETWPNRYLEMEQREQEVYDHIGSSHPFIRVQRNGERKYLSLREFRETYLEGPSQCDLFDWGGCGCFMEDAS